ncbi:hypothetical protein AGMMS50267_08620 [Spirochaetia bacterium]|nr:hypothetical protein AGMMS50267_08570 [Spirochaetia bacterium]GHV88502.1 hypothetical protein AGMMS50267_08620 [Spirochaetia bacterium]
MIKKLPLIFALALVFFCTACQNPVLSGSDRKVLYSVRAFPAPDHGYLRFSDSQVSGGTYIAIYANPEPGYVLKEISLQSAGGNPSVPSWTRPKFTTPINSNTDVGATFVPKNAGEYTVSVDPAIENGLVYPETMSSGVGTVVKINIIPDEGFDLVDGSLTVTKISGGNVPLLSDGLGGFIFPYSFVVPNEDVRIEAQFEKLSPDALGGRAWKYLSVGQYDIASSLYETAYQNNPNDDELILYSTLFKLANILIDPDVRSLLGSGSLYMSVVPNNLDDWVCDDVYWTGEESGKWYQEYAATTHTPDDATLPKIYSRISGFVTPFGDFPFAQQSGRDHLVAGDNRPTREKFINLIFWALISSYRTGFNPFIDRVQHDVFGKEFDEAIARAETLSANAQVRLNPRLKDQFDLEELYGSGDTVIGKHDLNYIVGNLLAVRGIFEYLSVYDWTIDLRPALMSTITWDDGLDSILDNMFNLQENFDAHKNLWRDLSTVARILPLKNNFLTIRNARAMDKAKADISGALARTNAAMDYWYSSSGGATAHFISTAQDTRRWAKEGLAAAQTAVSGGGTFYFPKRLPKSIAGSAWPTESTADYGVNTVKFFTPGAFTLTNLVTTEEGGRAPSLFKVEWYEDRANEYVPVFTGKYSPVTGPLTDTGRENSVAGTSNNAPYGVYTFEVNTQNLREIFPKGFEESGFFNDPATGADPNRALFSDVFPSIPLWPWAATYFTGSRRPAKKLYEFYHKTSIDIVTK